MSGSLGSLKKAGCNRKGTIVDATLEMSNWLFPEKCPQGDVYHLPSQNIHSRSWPEDFFTHGKLRHSLMRPVKAAMMEDMHCIHLNIVLRRTGGKKTSTNSAINCCDQMKKI